MSFLRESCVVKIGVSALILAVSGCASHATSDAVSRADLMRATPWPSTQQYVIDRKTDAQGLRINAMSAPADQTYYFAFDSDAVRAADLSALMVQARYLADHPTVKIRLEGNTDRHGSREYNIGLGWRRDQSIAKILEQQGVLPAQIQMVSYGKEHPDVLADTPAAWQANRRVVLLYKELV